MKTFLTGIAIITLTFVCHAQSKYFKVVDASYEEWTGGIPGAGSGKEYYFKAVIKTKKKITFDSVWVNNKVFKPIVVKGIQYDPKSEIHKNDTVVIRVSSKDPSKFPKPPKIGAASTEAAPPQAKEIPLPVKDKAEAVIGYTIEGCKKRLFFPMSKLRKRETVNRP